MKKVQLKISRKKHDLLSKAVGGDYWKQYLLDNNLNTKQRVEIICQRLH